MASVDAYSTGVGCCDGTLTAACAGAGDELLSDSYDLTEIEDGFFFAVRCLPCSRCSQLGLSASCLSWRCTPVCHLCLCCYAG